LVAITCPPYRAPAIAEQISFEGLLSTAQPASSVSALVDISANVVPLLGYSLNIHVVPDAFATGSLTVDLGLTNFYPARNLFTAARVLLDPVVSQIIDTGDGGLFINAISANLSTVVAAPNVNDVLAQVYLDVSANATGDFSLQLGPATALSDANGSSVP